MLTDQQLAEIEARYNFAAQAHADVPALLAEVRRLRAEVSGMTNDAGYDDTPALVDWAPVEAAESLSEPMGVEHARRCEVRLVNDKDRVVERCVKPAGHAGKHLTVSLRRAAPSP